MQHNNIVAEFQQLRGRWTTLLNRLYDDPEVAQVMNTRIGQYLSSHPFLALTLMLFIAMAALPVGLFLIFALVTTVMSAVGFIFFEVFLLFVAGLTLMCVLSGLALFSIMVSFIINAFHISVTAILNYYPQMTKQGEVQGKESGSETSKLKETE